MTIIRSIVAAVLLSLTPPAAVHAQIPIQRNAAPTETDNPQKQIVGGEEVQAGEFPFVVRIGGCTGSIIAPRWVLSAAHCFGRNTIPDPSLYSVSIGRERHHPIASRNVIKIILHPDYKADYKRDIALIEISRPFTVSPVKILTADEEPPSGSPSTSVGWGRLSDRSFPDVLRRADHSFLTPEECLRTTAWGKNRNNPSEPIGTHVDEGVLCFGNEYRKQYALPWGDQAGDSIMLRGGVAPGDSGGPLLVPIPGGWAQIGIHAAMGGADHPAKATRTSFFQDFISEHVPPVPPVTEIHFPFFAAGRGWVTELVFVNPSAEQVEAEILFFNAGGEPLTGSDPPAFTVPAGGLYNIVAPSGATSSDLASGSASVTFTGALNGFVRFTTGDKAWLGTQGTAPLDSLNTMNRPAVAAAKIGAKTTYVAVRNPDPEGWVNLSISLVSAGGKVLSEKTGIYIAPNGRYAKGLHTLFPEYRTDTLQFQGTVIVDTVNDAPVWVGAFEIGPNMFNGVPFMR